MSQRRIMMVCGAGYVSGKEIACLNLASGLRATGYAVDFVVSQWTNGYFPRRLSRAGFSFHPLRLGFIALSLKGRPLADTLNQLRFWPSLFFRYGRLLRRHKPDAVIHTNWQHVLLLLPYLKPSRDVFWLHEMARPTRSFACIYRAITKRTARIVCVSQAVAQSLFDVGVPASHVRVVHNGVAAVPIGSAPGRQPVLRLGIVGQIAPWKGHDDLIDAVAILARAGERIALRIFGAGDQTYVESLKRKIEALNIVDHVAWCGFRQDQDEIYAAIDVCVMPSRFAEPLGMSAIEAGLHGRPVICSARGGLTEIVQDGVTGLVVAAGRADRLAAAIIRLARDRELVRAMGEAARARVLAKFAIESLTARFIACLPAGGASIS